MTSTLSNGLNVPLTNCNIPNFTYTQINTPHENPLLTSHGFIKTFNDGQSGSSTTSRSELLSMDNNSRTPLKNTVIHNKVIQKIDSNVFNQNNINNNNNINKF